MKMVFHESYGRLPARTLRLVKKFNVSPADLDFMLDQFMFQADGHTPASWEDVDLHIVDNSPNGYYQPRFF